MLQGGQPILHLTLQGVLIRENESEIVWPWHEISFSGNAVYRTTNDRHSPMHQLTEAQARAARKLQWRARIRRLRNGEEELRQLPPKDSPTVEFWIGVVVSCTCIAFFGYLIVPRVFELMPPQDLLDILVMLAGAGTLLTFASFFTWMLVATRTKFHTNATALRWFRGILHWIDRTGREHQVPVSDITRVCTPRWSAVRHIELRSGHAVTFLHRPPELSMALQAFRPDLLPSRRLNLRTFFWRMTAIWIAGNLIAGAIAVGVSLLSASFYWGLVVGPLGLALSMPAIVAAYAWFYRARTCRKKAALRPKLGAVSNGT